MSTMPTRIDQALFDAARAAGEVHSRSAAQQLAHWARIGKELESSPGVTHGEIARVLAGQASYDDLKDERAQAIVRAEWDVQLTERLASLDLESELRATGKPWYVGDENGNVVVRGDAADAAA
ncbi:TA system antitoxin ParD family protein [Conexibacter woesei]|uniref:TA system antitoxin ParD family protein n=1 Tax=Conexibacter woesei TaxID=191495 RepID=UPI00041326F4|nr:hypothetical protein [Conexibacter woesei]